MIDKVSLRQIGYLIITLKAALVFFIILRLTVWSSEPFSLAVDSEFLLYAFAGFAAQLVDGALGMAYGVSCSSLLMQFGISPAIATASVHAAEVFTTGVSGLSHIWMKNVNKKLFFQVVIPGTIGAILGAFFISRLFDGNAIRPFVAAYLLLIGAVLIYKSFRLGSVKKPVRHAGLLGFFGGLFDAMGGGGWGPFVTSNLIAQGQTPKETIGTVNTAEFFIAFFSTGVFLFLTGLDSWKVIFGLIAGGVVAAPIGAWAAGRIPAKLLMRLVGTVVILLSFTAIWKFLR